MSGYFTIKNIFLIIVCLAVGFFLGIFFTKGFIRAEDAYANGFAYQQAKQFDKAIECFNKVIKHPASDEMLNKAYYNRGACYFDQKKYKQALPDLFRSIFIGGYDGDSYPYYLIGMSYYGIGYEDRALENLKIYLKKEINLGHNDQEKWLAKQLPSNFFEEPTKVPEPTPVPTKEKPKTKKNKTKK